MHRCTLLGKETYALLSLTQLKKKYEKNVCIVVPYSTKKRMHLTPNFSGFFVLFVCFFLNIFYGCVFEVPYTIRKLTFNCIASAEMLKL